ncbi:MAG: S46 family peptidase [Gemmatimonadota bacterium]|nr:MAG: S46 family peptidase [Gemmatimonadota bacterium]
MTANTYGAHGIWVRLVLLPAFVLTAGCSTSTAPVSEPTPAAPEAAPVEVAEPAPPALEMAEVEEIEAGEFDNGKMWTFEYAPLEYFADTYGFQPDDAWFEKARLGTLRIRRCSASFVSPNGLVLTNHHCARENVSEVSGPGETLLDDGFYAASLEEERVTSQTADQLIAIEDVTAEVHAALEGVADAERGAALAAIGNEISERIAAAHGGDDAGVLVEVTALWDGARYSAYVFHRYTDLRLVAAPELLIGNFGGDYDNFTYPRYNLDFSFFRVYDEAGNPLRSEHWFTWSEAGVEEGDAVFVIGNPGGTSRMQTVSQLEWRRAARDKAIHDLYKTRADALQAFYDEDPETGEQMDLRNEIHDLRNQEKFYLGTWQGLQNPEYMARRRDSERKFRAAIESDSALNAEYGGLLDQMAEIQRRKTEYAADFGAFLAFGIPDYDAAILLRAYLAYLYVRYRRAGAPAAALEDLKGDLLSIADQPVALQRELLAARLEDFERNFGAQSEIVRKILQGRSPEAAAEAMVANSALADSASTGAALQTGALSMDDPAVRVIEAIVDRLRTYQAALQGLIPQEDAITARLGRARFDVYGTALPPDATSSPRIADGVVTGYEYNGTIAPVYTTFYGLYDHYYSYGGRDWDLPARWLSPASSFDLSTPLNFVNTADTTGGNSGSPALNADLEIVGLIFDGNIEGLAGDYIYDAEVNRSIAVDVRGILEALDEIYDADRIVLELTTGQLVDSEEEADAVMTGR